MRLSDVNMMEYSEGIVKSSPSTRVGELISDVRENMILLKKEFIDYGRVLNEQTAKLPLIVRKAMSERQKLSTAPVGIWDKQFFAGCFSFKDEGLTNSKDLPVFALEEEIREGQEYGFGIYSMFGHISPDFPRLLSLGTSGIRKMAEEKLADDIPQKSRDFLTAALISLEGLDIFAKRHSDWLFEKAANTNDSMRKKELLNTANALKNSPLNPAATYIEACQSAWLLHLAFQLTDNHLALGRPDQYLYPFLKDDLAAERLTLEEAQEITDCFLLKFNERAMNNQTSAQMKDIEREQEENEKRWRERKLYDIGQQRYNIRDTIDATNHWNQNVVIGGLIPEDGRDATNILSVMILESFRRLRMTNPVLTVRIHNNSPQWFLRQVAQTLRTGGGLPAIYNDETIIKAFTKFGIEEKDARDYANNGCWEALLPGKTDFYFLKLNTLKCLEWTLNNGICHIDDKQEVPDQGDPSKYTSFDEIFEKTMENIQLVAEGSAKHMLYTHPHRSSIAPVPLLSALLDGPIEKGLDMTDMGARLVVGGTIAEGISHLIDSLCAIDKVVFKEKKCTMGDLVDAIDSDFENYQNLRTLLSNSPKFGTNDQIADEMGRKVIDRYVDIIYQIDQKYDGMKFMPGVGTFSWYIAIGEGTGASADGRLSGKPVASNFSPSSGALTKGITAAINSFCHMGLDGLPLGSPLDLGMAERYVAGEEGINRLMGLLKTFVELGGNMLTISVADTETLQRAQKKPEDYKDLRVRMGGWSAYFTMLSKEQQDHHIKKSEGGIF
ncbi:MAG TPA: pyruvate formate lyase family protein [Ruminiclostridium sp.]